MFLNIRIDHDNKFFIDPTLIEKSVEKLAKDAYATIINFFEEVLNLFEKGEYDKARDLLVYSSESNEIFLGYTEGFPQGTGNSKEMLTEVFDRIMQERMIENGLIQRVEDISIFIEDFGPDRLSDLVASIIKKHLIIFTRQQCEKHGIECNYTINKKYWSKEQKKWCVLEEEVPCINYQNKEYPVVLVPKNFITNKSLYSAEIFWNNIVSGKRQEYHKDNNTELYQENVRRPGGKLNKKVIKQKEVKEGIKKYLYKFSCNDKATAIKEFREDIKHRQRGTHSGVLLDDEIEKKISESYKVNNAKYDDY